MIGPRDRRGRRGAGAGDDVRRLGQRGRARRRHTVLVDSVPGTGLIDLDAAGAAITPRTRAIMPVHLAGRPVDMDRLAELRDRHRLHVDRGRGPRDRSRVARDTDRGVRQRGGLLVLRDQEHHDDRGRRARRRAPRSGGRVERLALHGLSLGAWQRFSDAGFRHYEVVRPGFKFNMTDVQAALGLHQLPQLDGWIDRRARIWERYDALLAELPLESPPPGARPRHARHLYQVLVAPAAPLDPRRAADALTERNIGTGVHYRGVHLHPFYRDTYGLADADFPVATDISERTLSLPLSPKVTEADQDDVAAALIDLLGGSAGSRAPRSAARARHAMWPRRSRPRTRRARGRHRRRSGAPLERAHQQHDGDGRERRQDRAQRVAHELEAVEHLRQVPGAEHQVRRAPAAIPMPSPVRPSANSNGRPTASSTIVETTAPPRAASCSTAP